MRNQHRIALALILLFNAAPPTQTPAPPDPHFGAVEAYLLPDQAAELRVGWDRMVIHWYERQPDNSDQWIITPEETERIGTAGAWGREIVGLLMGTPWWATDGVPAGGVPRGLYLPVDDPGNLWAVFVRRMAGEYKGKINHWIIWNEPDIALEDYGAQFAGSVEDYYQLIKVAYLAAKQANPDAVIHFAGLTYWHDTTHGRRPYIERFLEVARKDPSARAHNYYFDVFTAHVYFRAETVFSIINFYRNILNTHGLRQPIWLNETNAAPDDDPQYPAGPLLPVTMDQQAAFIVESNALALAAGAARIAVYKFFDDAGPPPGGESYGLFRPDGSARPAADAFRMVTTYFSGVRQTTYQQRPAYWLVTLNRGTAITRIVWARTATTVTLSLRATPNTVGVELYNHRGQSSPIEPDRNGYYRLTLPAAACDDVNGCVVGGSPWIVVETIGAAAETKPAREPSTGTR